MIDYRSLQLEEKDIARGYSINPILGLHPDDLHSITIQTGHSQQQSVQSHGDLILLQVTNEGACQARTISFEPISTPIDQPEQFLEESIRQTGGTTITLPSPKHDRSGLPDEQLVECPRLKGFFADATGLSACRARISVNPSFEWLQKQDFNCQSMFFLSKGSPRIWLIVAPRHAEMLEAYISSKLDHQESCSQFIAHQHIVVPPSTLRDWGITFSVAVQSVGQALLMDYNVYFFAFDTGANFFESIACCDDTWLIPPSYRPCSHNDGPRLDSNTDSPMFCDLRASRTSPLQGAADNVLHSPEGDNLEMNPTHDQDFSCSTPVLQELPHSSSQILSPGNEKLPLAPSISSDDFPSSMYEHSTLALVSQSGTTRQREQPTEMTESAIESGKHKSETPLSEQLQSQDGLSSGISSASNTRGSERSPPEPTYLDLTLSGSAVSPLIISDEEEAGDAEEGPALFTDLSGETSLFSNALKSFQPSRQPEQIQKDIETLIEYGIKYKEFIQWPFHEQPSDVDSMLRRFCPGSGHQSWLSGDCVNQVLATMVKNSANTTFVDSYSLARFVKLTDLPQWIPVETLDVVLLPVNRGNSHWVLVHMDVRHHVVVVHEDHAIGEAEWLQQTMQRRMPNPSWTLEIKNTYPNPSHTECGIILLAEAEKLILGRESMDFDSLALRKRYLGLLLEPTLREFEGVKLLQLVAPTCASPRPDEQVSWRPDDVPNKSLATDSTEYLVILSSAVGCEEVLHDLKSVVTDSTRLRHPKSHLDMAMTMYMVGNHHSSLGWIQKDAAAVVIANTCNTLKAQVQSQQRTSSYKGRRGVGVDTIVYDKLIKSCSGLMNTSSLRKSLKSANYRGQKLLAVSKLCGPGRPLWLLFPTRTLKAPNDPDYTVNPWEYRDLTADNMRALVDLIRESRKEFWDMIPLICSDILGGYYDDVVREVEKLA